MQGFRPQFNVIMDIKVACPMQGFRPQFNVMMDIKVACPMQGFRPQFNVIMDVSGLLNAGFLRRWLRLWRLALASSSGIWLWYLALASSSVGYRLCQLQALSVTGSVSHRLCQLQQGNYKTSSFCSQDGNNNILTTGVAEGRLAGNARAFKRSRAHNLLKAVVNKAYLIIQTYIENYIHSRGHIYLAVIATSNT